MENPRAYTVESSKGTYFVTVTPMGLRWFLVAVRRLEAIEAIRPIAPAVFTDNVQRTVNEIVPD